MRLTAKLVAAFVGVMLVVLACDAVLLVRHRATLFESGLRLDMVRFGGVLAEVVAEAEARQGPERASNLVDRLNDQRQGIQIRIVHLGATPLAETPAVTLTPEELATLSAGAEVIRVGTEDGASDRMLTYVPLPGGNAMTPREVLELSQSLAVMDRFTQSVVVRSLVLAAVMLGAGAVTAAAGGVWLVGRPLARLTEKTRRVGEGDLSGPVVLRRRDELGQLGRSLNEMCDRLSESQEKVRRETEARIAAVEQLRHADRLRTVGRLASGVAHEIGTPLNVISGRAVMIVDGGLSDPEVKEGAGIIRRQSQRITRIVRQLLDFSRRSTPSMEPADLRQLIRDTVELVTPMARAASVAVELPADGPALPAVLDPGKIQQVLTNLLMNGIQATPAGGKVTVVVEHVAAVPPDAPHGLAPRDCWRIDVTDTGVGISAEHLDNLFEPFFTTKDVGKGTGLGLAVAEGIVREHGGWITVQSKVGQGSTFSVFLPREVQA